MSKPNKLRQRLLLVFVLLVCIVTKRIPIKEGVSALKKLINKIQKKSSLILLKNYILISKSKYGQSKVIRKWLIIPVLKVLIRRFKKRFIYLCVKTKKVTPSFVFFTFYFI